MSVRLVEITNLASTYGKKVSDVEKLITNRTHYHGTRMPSLSNALTHKKGVEMNKGVLFSYL